MERLKMGEEKDPLLIPNPKAHLWNTRDNFAFGVSGFH